MDETNMFLLSEIHVEEDTDDINFEVLHPENPLMIRFQNALRQMLENKLNHVRAEVAQTKNEIKEVNKEKQEVTEQLFFQKSELQKLEESLYRCNESLSDTINQRELVHLELEQNRELHNKHLIELSDREKLNAELQHKVEVQSYIYKQLQEYDQSMASTLTIIQQEMSKHKTEKTINLEKKAKWDYFLMKLENEIFRLDLLVNEYKEKLKFENVELSKLQESLSSKNVKLKNISDDNTRLLRTWEHTISVAGKRDKLYSTLKTRLEKLEIVHKEKLIAINHYKRQTEKEMLQNEALLAEKIHQKELLNKLVREHVEMTEQYRILEEECFHRTCLLESTDKTLGDAEQVQNDYQRELTSLEIKFKKLNDGKHQLDETILSYLQNEIVSSKSTSKLNEEIHKIRKLGLEQESVVRDLSSKYFAQLAELEEIMACANIEGESLMKLKQQIGKEESELQKLEYDLKILNSSIQCKNIKLAEERSRLALFQDKPSSRSELDEKIDRTRNEIKDMNKKIRVENRSWIRKQNEIVKLVKKTSKLSEELNFLQEKVAVLEQKNERIDHNILEVDEAGMSCDKSIAQILKIISRLNGEFSDKKLQRESLENKNFIFQNEITEKLAKAEKEMHSVVWETEELEQKREILEKELSKVQQKELEWENKVKSANEMKKHILNDQSEKGDIGSMKNEIHRMEIRYGQLKKAQETLISNMEMSVSKRNRIFDQTIAKEKTEDDLKRQKLKLKRHIDNLKDKNCKLQEKVERFEKEYSDLCFEKKRLSSELKECETKIRDLQEETIKIDEQIEEYQSLKHKNLEILIRKQRMTEFFSKLRSGKVKPTMQNELMVEKDLLKYRSLQSDLKETLEYVCKEYPDYRSEIKRILNVLESSAV